MKRCQKSKYSFVECKFTAFGQTTLSSCGAHQTWMKNRKKPNIVLLNIMSYIWESSIWLKVCATNMGIAWLAYKRDKNYLPLSWNRSNAVLVLFWATKREENISKWFQDFATGCVRDCCLHWHLPMTILNRKIFGLYPKVKFSEPIYEYIFMVITLVGPTKVSIAKLKCTVLNRLWQHDFMTKQIFFSPTGRLAKQAGYPGYNPWHTW